MTKVPVTKGLTGWYTGATLDPSSGTWLDLSGQNNHARASGTVSLAPAGINGLPFLFGESGSSQVVWPQVGAAMCCNQAKHQRMCRMLVALGQGISTLWRTAHGTRHAPDVSYG
jgi:hypothetical protein